MKVKKISVIILIMIAVIMSSCNASKAGSESADQSESAKATVTESIWVREDGLKIQFNEEENWYLIMNASKQVGYGKYVKNEEGYFIEYGSYWYEVKFKKNNKIKLISKSKSNKGALADSVLEKDDTADISSYALTELQGIWQNPDGSILEFDTQKKRCIIVSEKYGLHVKTEVRDEFKGMGNYILVDDIPVYIRLTEKGITCGYKTSSDKIDLSFLNDNFKRISYDLEDE